VEGPSPQDIADWVCEQLQDPVLRAAISGAVGGAVSGAIVGGAPGFLTGLIAGGVLGAGSSYASANFGSLISQIATGLGAFALEVLSGGRFHGGIAAGVGSAFGGVAGVFGQGLSEAWDEAGRGLARAGGGVVGFVRSGLDGAFGFTKGSIAAIAGTLAEKWAARALAKYAKDCKK